MPVGVHDPIAMDQHRCRVSMIATSDIRVINNERREMGRPIDVARRVAVKMVERVLYEIPHVRFDEVQVDVYAWDAGTKAWESAPVATTDRKVWGQGKLWQHNLTLLAAKGSDRATAWKSAPPALTKGRYLLKVYVDGADRLAADWKAVLADRDYAGQVEVASDWPAGKQTSTACWAKGA